MEKNKEEVSREISAILFACGEPVFLTKLSKFTKLNEKQLLDSLRKLEPSLEECGLTLVYHKKSVQLVSDKTYAEVIMKFLNKQLDEKISKTALETLAVVLYKGPVSRAEIEYVRGVNCNFALRNLLMRGLIERRENPEDTRSYLYCPSIELMKNLGIKKLEDLPDYKRFSQNYNILNKDNDQAAMEKTTTSSQEA